MAGLQYGFGRSLVSSHSMSTGDFSFSLNVGPRPVEHAPRLIARPFEAHPVGEEAMVLAAGAESAQRLPLLHVHALSRCDRFRSLEQHVETLIHDFALPADQGPALRHGLETLVRNNLLRDERQVLEELGHGSSLAAASAVDTLCIRTCQRPDDLLALLRSLDRHIADSGLCRILVLDDSPHTEASAQTAAAIARAGLPAALEIVHVDRARRERLIQALAARAGIEPGAIEWLINGDPEDREASYGSNLNLALLLTAGRRFFMIDDDSRLDPHQIQPPARGLSLRVQHHYALRFPRHGLAETEQFEALPINPLSAHAELLGQPIAAIAQGFGLQDGHLLRELSPQMIHEFSLRPRLRLTTNGTLGDSGSGDMLWLYALPAETLRPWLESPQAYEQAVYGRRMARSVLETQIAASVSLMTTTLTGVDNRELLLPVGAKGRGEDLVFGALVRYLHPGTPCAALPWMLPHRLESIRRWAPADLHRPRHLGLNTYLAMRIEDLVDTQLPGEPMARARVLAAWMRSLNGMDDAELIPDLRRCLLERRARTAADIRQTLATLEPPTWLRRDFERLVEGQLRLDATDTDSLRQLAGRVRSFGAGYGEGLESWLRGWQWVARGGLSDLLDAIH